MDDSKSDALSRLAAVGESLFSPRITPEDDMEASTHRSALTSQNSLQKYRESTSRDASSRDLSENRAVMDGPSIFSNHSTFSTNNDRFSGNNNHELQLIETERRKLLGYEDELILQDHILTHEKILLQKKVEESALFAIRQMRLLAKDELTSRFYDIEKIINKQDMVTSRYRENSANLSNLHDSSGVRSILHRILIEETMPLTWSNSRYPSTRDTNIPNDTINRLESSSRYRIDRAASSSDGNSMQRTSITDIEHGLLHKIPSTSERIALESMIHEMPKKRNFQEDVELHAQDSRHVSKK